MSKMDYIAWAQEYSANAKAVQEKIEKLKEQREKCNRVIDRKELDEKILILESIRYEMAQNAFLLRQRGEKQEVRHESENAYNKKTEEKP